MIAICREDSARKDREERYALRRLLVGRLQKASRGIPRRSRFEHHRQFAEEWSRFARDGRLDLLKRALLVGPAVAAEAGEGWRASLLLSLAADVVSPVALRRHEPTRRTRSVRESAGEQAGSALDSPVGVAAEARSWRDPGRAAGLQEDLFPAYCVPQPA